MNQFPLSLSGLGQEHFHPWGWNKKGSNHQHSRPSAFPEDAVGVGVWCVVLLGVSVASAPNNHHVSTYVWPTCLQAGSRGVCCTWGQVCPGSLALWGTEEAGLLPTKAGRSTGGKHLAGPAFCRVRQYSIGQSRRPNQ